MTKYPYFLTCVALVLFISATVTIAAEGEDGDAVSEKAQAHVEKAREVIMKMGQIKDKKSSEYKKLYETAVRELEAAHREAPKNEGLARSLAELYLGGGDYAKCVSLINKFAGSDTEDIRFLFQKGQAYFYLKKFADAEKTFKRIMTVDPNNKETALQALVKVYSQWRKWDKLIDTCKEIIGIKYDNETQFTLGNAYLLDKKFAEAVEALKKVLENDPKHANALICLIDAYGNQKMYDKAVEACKSFLETHPDHPNAKQVTTNMKTYEKLMDKKD